MNFGQWFSPEDFRLVVKILLPLFGAMWAMRRKQKEEHEFLVQTLLSPGSKFRAHGHTDASDSNRMLNSDKVIYPESEPLTYHAR